MYNAPILKKALDIIRLITKENKPLTVTQIARSLNISKSTTFGILRSLEEEGLLFKDETSKRYSTGNTLFELSKVILRGTDVTVIARPYLEQLLAKVDETVCLGIREEDKVKVVDVLEPKKKFKISMPVGAEFSLPAGVMAKTFLSALSDEEVRGVLSKHRLRRYTENSICDIDEFLRELKKTRSLGYAVDLEEYLKGIRAIGTLVYAGHFPVAALWVMGFAASMDDLKLSQMTADLKEAAAQISTRLSPSPAQ